MDRRDRDGAARGVEVGEADADVGSLRPTEQLDPVGDERSLAVEGKVAGRSSAAAILSCSARWMRASAS